MFILVSSPLGFVTGELERITWSTFNFGTIVFFKLLFSLSFELFNLFVILMLVTLIFMGLDFFHVYLFDKGYDVFCLLL